MKYTPKPIELSDLHLPSADELGNYRQLCEVLKSNPPLVSPEAKQAFCELALGVSPDLLDMQEVELVEKIAPEQWKDYCNYHWGAPTRITLCGDSCAHPR